MAALAPAAALGCGGSASSGSETAAPLTKAAYLKKGDQICKKRLEEKDEVVKAMLEQLSSSGKTNPSSEDLEALGKAVLQPIRELADELDELPAPARSKAAAKKVTSEFEVGLKKAEADPSELVESNPFEKASRAARAYGFKACNF